MTLAVILLDENIIVDQVDRLRRRRIRCRHIGHDFEPQGIHDDNILPVLHRLRPPTLLTRDLGLYRRSICHPHYCIICLQVRELDVAAPARLVAGRISQEVHLRISQPARLRTSPRARLRLQPAGPADQAS